jgi:hypothetical protein
MEFSAEQLRTFGVALNEATVIAVDVESARRAVAVTLGVLSLPTDDGPAPGDPRVVLLLEPVGRIAASLRHGRWDDADARVETFALEDLAGSVKGFEQQSIYGWQFLDVSDGDAFEPWAERLSVDWRSEPGGLAHTLDLFQESAAGPARILDLRIWFDELRIFRPDGSERAFDEFTAAGVRWWDGLKSGDPRTAGHGIASAGES